MLNRGLRGDDGHQWRQQRYPGEQTANPGFDVSYLNEARTCPLKNSLTTSSRKGPILGVIHRDTRSMIVERGKLRGVMQYNKPLDEKRGGMLLRGRVYSIRTLDPPEEWVLIRFLTHLTRLMCSSV
jgi:hypothetical protein